MINLFACLIARCGLFVIGCYCVCYDGFGCVCLLLLCCLFVLWLCFVLGFGVLLWFDS